MRLWWTTSPAATPRPSASLIPRALMAAGAEALTIFGTDYPTPDGTCLRDYIHISDLSQAHLAAITLLDAPGHRAFNVGTGRPHSVREVIAVCERVVGRPIPAVEGPRRAGDVAISLADPGRFQHQTGFRATLGLEAMVASTWKWRNTHRLQRARLITS